MVVISDAFLALLNKQPDMTYLDIYNFFSEYSLIQRLKRTILFLNKNMIFTDKITETIIRVSPIEDIDFPW